LNKHIRGFTKNNDENNNSTQGRAYSFPVKLRMGSYPQQSTVITYLEVGQKNKQINKSKYREMTIIRYNINVSLVQVYTQLS